MKIIINEKQNELINKNLFIKPNNWKKIKPFLYKNIPSTLYFNYDNNEFYINDIGTKKIRLVPTSEYSELGSTLKPTSSNYINKLKDNLIKFKDVNNSTTNPNIIKQKLNKPIINNSIKKTETPNKIDNSNNKWVSIWEKFLVKYNNSPIGDKTNNTNSIDNSVYNYIIANKHLYKNNKYINSPNLKKLLTDGKKGPIHDSFLPPYYTKNNVFPIYFLQKSDKILDIQKKLGVKPSGIFLNKTENAIIKHLKFKNSNGYNVTYNRKNGLNDEIYKVIMSNDVKNNLGKPELIKRKDDVNINVNNIELPKIKGEK